MTHMRPALAALALTMMLGSSDVLAQRGGGDPQPMTFFVTSVPVGDGGNLGGLAGADAHCQRLATAAGRGAVTWRAYLSTQGPGGVNARDRIGTGPWHNAGGGIVGANLGELHGDTIAQARLGNRLSKDRSRDQNGDLISGIGDQPNQHDILTGSMPDGRAFTDGVDHTCGNYTSSADTMGSVQLGHHDKTGGRVGSGSWNSAHASLGCSQQNLIATGGNGYLYCFAGGD